MINRKSGFTLIEMLVVIVIIAILAAILFPMLARARAKAQQTLCLSNMKQAVLALHMYSADYDDYAPTKMGSDAVPATVRYPWHLMMAYVGPDSEVMQCSLSAGTFRTPRHPKFAPSYHTFGQGWKTTLSACTMPIKTAYFSESYTKEYATHWDVCNPWVTPGGAPTDSGPKPWAPAHTNGNNFGFVDGHARYDTGNLYREYANWRYLVEWQK